MSPGVNVKAEAGDAFTTSQWGSPYLSVKSEKEKGMYAVYRGHALVVCVREGVKWS